jgi:hypothetical protein
MDQCARGGERRAADASPAMQADTLTGAKAIGQIRNKGPEGAHIRRHVNILNRVGEKLHAQLPGKRSFLAQPKPISFVWLEQRDECLHATLRNLAQFVVKNAAAAWTKHNGQLHRRISFDPKHLVHAFRLPQTDSRAGAP